MLWTSSGPPPSHTHPTQLTSVVACGVLRFVFQGCPVLYPLKLSRWQSAAAAPPLIMLSLLLCVSTSFAPSSPTASIIVDIGGGIRVTASEATHHFPALLRRAPSNPFPPGPRNPPPPACPSLTTRFPRSVTYVVPPIYPAQFRPRSSESSPRARRAMRIARPSWWWRAT